MTVAPAQVGAATAAAPTVSVVVCCFTDRRRLEILAAIGSLRAQSHPPAEIVVVVDHNPGLLDWLTGRFDDVVLVANARSQGLTGARNTGVELSTGEVVAFLDDDAVAAPDWLALLVAEYTDPGVIAVGGGIDPDWVASRPAWFPMEFGWVVGCSYTGQPTERSVVRNVIGANMSFRRAVIERVGGFRRELGRVGTLPAGCEETELCIRATAESGGRVVYQPRALVSHRVTPERGEWRYFRSRCVAEGRSKAVVAGLAGSEAALETERSYVARVLPLGVLLGVCAGLAGEPGGFGRAAAIVAGLSCTGTGYLAGRARLAFASAPRPPALRHSAADESVGAEPGGVWCGEIELSGPDGVTAVVPYRPNQDTVRVLVRLHGEPLGYVTLPAAGGRPDRDEVRRAAWSELSHRVVEHLTADGLEGGATDGGIPLLDPPAHTCVNRVTAAELVSVVVCTRQRSEILGACLASIQGLGYRRLEVIVVDNAPLDTSTHEVVRRIQETDHRFRYVVEPHPGLSSARNAGLRAARGSIIAYTDDDVLVDHGWIDGVVRGFRTRSDVACVTGLVCSASIDGPLEAYFDARAAAWWNRCRRELFDLRTPPPDSPLFPFTPALFGTGANVAFRRRFLEDSGGFDEALGAGTRTRGGEDIDKFVDTLLRGEAIAYEPSAIVWHRHRGDRAGLLRQMYGYGTGLTAFVAKVLTRPATALQVLARVPCGVARVARRRTETATGLATAAPRGAALVEAVGLLTGPYLYARARWERRHRPSP